MKYYSEYLSPLGILTLVCENNHLIGLWMQDQKHYAATLNEKPVKSDNEPVLIKTREWLTRYFSGLKPEPSEIPLAPQGNDFRQNVWEELCKIPYGATSTYGEISKIIASKLGKKNMSAQAIGGAVGHNPIGIIIPCHRVLGKNGALTGYAGGLDKKIFLLELEKAYFKR